MNKEWYVFKGTHHLGPFSVEEMEEFFQTGEINAQTLIWKEGTESWEALSKTVAFQFLFTESSPPPLPELPPFSDNGDLPPPVPLDVIIDPKGQIRRKIAKVDRSSRYSKYAIIFGSVILLTVVAWYALTQKEAAIQLRIKGIMPVYLERLEMTAVKNSSRFEVAIALSLDGLTLWGSTNLNGEIATVIKMDSIPHKVLGTEEVALTVRGNFMNHLARFDKMILVRGSKFLPGEYHFHAEGRQVHFLNQHFKSLRDIPFFKSLNKSYVFEGTTLIYPGTPREFEKRLLQYGTNILTELLKPLQDKLERIQTFESILNATSQNYLMELEKAKSGKEILSFETKFMKEISPLLQSLVVKASELSLDPKVIEEEEKRGQAVSSYKDQIQLGKEIGEMASDMITETKKIKKLTDKEKRMLNLEFEKRSIGIKKQIDGHIKKLEEQIQKLSN